MRVSFFDHARDEEPKYAEDFSWDKFVELCSEHEFTSSPKLSCPAFSPCEFVEGGSRNNAEAIRVHLAVLDVDGNDPDPTSKKKGAKIPGIREEELSRILELCAPYEFLLYTSYSHGVCKDGRSKVRLVFPLSRPVLASEWDRFWPRMYQHLSEGLADPKCKEVARIYFLAFAPVGDEAYSVHNPGKVLDVAEIMSLPGPKASTSPSKASATTEDGTLSRIGLEALCKKLKRRTTEHAALMGHALVKVLRGDPYSEEGGRDETLFKLIGEIVRFKPTVDPESLVELFAPSHSLMEAIAPGAPDADLVRAKTLRAKADVQASEEQKAAIQETDLKLRIRETFQGRRENPYTAEEIKTIALNAGVSEEELLSHWIYQKGRSYYFRMVDGIRGPRVKAEMTKNATILLAPAVTAGVDTYTATPTGTMIPKTPDQLVEDYGTPLATVQASLIAQETHYDRNSHTLVEAVCPLRALEPREDAQVARWLELFGGKLHEKLLDWLALVIDLSQPLPALYFDGPKSVGKSLFAESIARLWTTTQATPMSALARSFNSQITECPVVFADEIVPPEFRGDKGTGRLRALIAERSRSLTRKFIPDSTLVGSIRLIIAGNNDTLISAEENLTEADIHAIVDRILYLEIPASAGVFLAGLPDLGESFRTADRVAQHVLYLAETRHVERRTRFGIPGEAGKLHQTLKVSAGSRSPVLNWLAGALLNWDSLQQRPKVASGLRIQDGELLVNTSAMVEGWGLVTTNARPPSTQKIGKALATFSDGKRRELGGVKYQVINLDNLLAWCLETGYMSDTQVKACMDKAENNPRKRAN